MKKYNFFIVFLLFFLSACSVKAPLYSSDYSSLDILSSYNLKKISVATVEPSDPKAGVNKIKLRSSTMIAQQGTFSAYLEDALKADLIDAKLFDQSSEIKLYATIIKNDIKLPIKDGRGVMEVNFILKDNREIYNKLILVTTNFESFFGGTFAIPKGMQEYPNLVRALIKKLFLDKEFINALKQENM